VHEALLLRFVTNPLFLSCLFAGRRFMRFRIRTATKLPVCQPADQLFQRYQYELCDCCIEMRRAMPAAF